MRVSALLLALLCTGTVQAQTAYRWVDQEGKVHYGDRPPPHKTVREIESKKLTANATDKELSYAVREAARNFPVTLYASADCGAPCKDGRELLVKRGVPFEEKSVVTAEDIDALKKLLGGAAAAIPVLLVGDKTRIGFLATAWGDLLDAAGYPKAPGR